MLLRDRFWLGTMRHSCSHQQGNQEKCFVTYHPKYCSQILIFSVFLTFLFSSNFKLENTLLVLFLKDRTRVKCVRLLGYDHCVHLYYGMPILLSLSLSSFLMKSQASSLSTTATNNLSVFTLPKEKYWLRLTTDISSRTSVSRASYCCCSCFSLDRWV